MQQYLSMSRRHSTVSTIINCSQNFFDVGFVGFGNGFIFIQDYLFARTQVNSLSQGGSTSKCISHGVPQGTFLSVLLFSYIYINDIVELSLKGHLQLYANDAILIYSESNYDELQRHLREDLLKIHDWFYNNLLSLMLAKRNI
jgi:hypothetical protein